LRCFWQVLLLCFWDFKKNFFFAKTKNSFAFKKNEDFLRFFFKIFSVFNFFVFAVFLLLFFIFSLLSSHLLLFCRPRAMSKTNYKTELCLSFKTTGACRYRRNCQFAHGPQELNPLTLHPNHKTKQCKNFSNGICHFGKRCRFLHLSSQRHVFEEIFVPQPGADCQRRLPVFTKLFVRGLIESLQ